jgi:ketosteroid isomerase-like protein
VSLIQENVAIVRGEYRAFNDADLATLAELFDDNASWHTPGRSPVGGDAVGRNAVFARFGRYLRETGGTFRADLKRATNTAPGSSQGLC